jgi:hypothetical protein
MSEPGLPEQAEWAVRATSGCPGASHVLALSTRPIPDRPWYCRGLLLPFPVSPENVQCALGDGALELEIGRASQAGVAERKQPWTSAFAPP